MSKLTVGTENKTPVELHYEDHGVGINASRAAEFNRALIEFLKG